MQRILAATFVALLLASASRAETIPVRSFRHIGPFPVQAPLLIDSVDVHSKGFDSRSFLDAPLSREGLAASSLCAGDDLPAGGDGWSLGWIAFSFENRRFARVTLSLEGMPETRCLYVDGKAAEGALELVPGTHLAEIKYLLEPGRKASPAVSIETTGEGILSLREDGLHRYGMRDVLLGTRIAGVAVSPDGKWLITSYTTTREGGFTEHFC